MTTVRPILVTGGNGQLGRELARAPCPAGWVVVALGRDRLDLTNSAAVRSMVVKGFEGTPWGAVINAGAFTAVDRAEAAPVAGWAVNALAPLALAGACSESGVPLVQVSTDYVFAGDDLLRNSSAGAGAWEVDDSVGPLSVYGASKLAGELAVRSSGARYAIVRTSWLVSASGNNFVRTMLRLGAEREVVRVVGDQRGSPTSARDLAEALLTIAIRLAEDEGAATGVFHFSNSGATDWATLATETFRQSGLRGGPTAKVEVISTAEYPTPARRPANSVLSHGAIGAAYGIFPRPWQDALGEILDELIGPIESIGVRENFR